MITTEKLTELRDRAYKTACDKGFYDEQKPDAVYKMLIITEIAEAVQADRKGMRADKDAFDKYEAEGLDFAENFEKQIKNSVEDELADIIIRMLDYCGMKGIEFDKKYNRFPFNRLCVFRTFPEAMYDLCDVVLNVKEVFALRIVFKYCKGLGIDILWFVEMKMRYNETRERMHGRKY